MVVRSSRWTLGVRPERGGRITSLRLDGEELLDQGIGVDRPGAAGFVEAGAWGWDEMVPTIDPTGDLPDHGEAWRLPWEVLRQDSSTVLMRCSGRLRRWELERHLDVGDDYGVTATYVYRNVGSVPLAAYWAAHPLFRYEDGMEIGVPGGAELAHLGEGTSTKVFLPSGLIDRARLKWASGAAIEMRWDGEIAPHVGVWVCNGDLGGYRQIAIEPATGGFDRPDSPAPAPILQPGEEIYWWMEVRDARGRG
jgi:galactose mutarotase-like enzyme